MITVHATELSTPVVESPAVPSPIHRLRQPRRVLLAALGLGVCAEVLFDGPALGLSFPLFVLLFVAALLGTGGREGWQRARPNAWLLVPLLFFSGMVCVRANAFLTTLNVLASGLLLLGVTHFWAAGRVERLGLWGYPLTVLQTLVRSFLLPVGVVRSQVDLSAAREQVPKLMPVLRGALLALPVLLLFAGLLASGDEVFGEAVLRVLSLRVEVPLLWALEHGVFVAAGAFGALGLLAHAQRRRGGHEAGEAEVAPVPGRLGFTESLTLVGLVDLLFLGFASIQLAFLFGAARLPVGLTYSVYARRGFFQLLAVSVLTLGLSLVLERWTRLKGSSEVRAFQVACSAMVGLVLVILASAMKRMGFYESAYGYTQLRVYTQVFMVALAGVLAWRGVTLWWRPERFAIGAFVGALGFLVALDVLNPDALIVRANLERAHGSDTGVDGSYMALSLSEDAAPELVAGFQGKPVAELSPYLREALCRYPAPMAGGWPAFHLARHRAAQWRASLTCPAPGSAEGAEEARARWE